MITVLITSYILIKVRISYRKIKTIPFWGNPYFIIDNEDETTDVYISQMRDVSANGEKGFYADELSGEGPFY